jgi:alkylation response protein AidB-like acyl-CoA dehydrogenase
MHEQLDEGDALEFGWSAEERALRDRLEELTTSLLDPSWTRSIASVGSSAASEQSNAFCRALAEHDALVRSWPVEYGGQAAARWEQQILAEVMWARGEPRGPQYMNVNWIGPAIMRFGTEAQKQLHLPRMAAGDVVWCQGFSEPDAGSDLAALRTTAIRDGEEYVINGEKIWTSYASDAQFCFLLARTDPTQERNRGISVFLVPMDTPGLDVHHIPAVIGDHAFHDLVFTDVRVHTDTRLGPEHEGWEVVTTALANERVGLPRYVRAGQVLDALAAWAIDQGLLPDSWVEARLGEVRAIVEAARLLAYRAVDDQHRGLAPTGHANVARVAIVDAERAVAEISLELMGTAGLLDGELANAQVRNGLAAGIASGTYEVQLNTISNLLMKLPKA